MKSIRRKEVRAASALGLEGSVHLMPFLMITGAAHITRSESESEAGMVDRSPWVGGVHDISHGRICD